MPIDGTWTCKRLDPKLPSFGTSLKAVVAARRGTQTFRAAVALDEGEEEGTLLLLETDAGGSSWLPIGEARMPVVRDQLRLSLSPLADSVFMSSGHGEMLTWAFDSVEPVETVSPVQAGLHTKWHGACPLNEN